MEVNESLINHLCDLANLKFTEVQLEQIQADLQRMIFFVEKLNELDTTNVPALQHMGETKNIFRKDHVVSSLSRDQALRNAPQADGIYFRVPKVIKNPKGQAS